MPGAGELGASSALLLALLVPAAAPPAPEGRALYMRHCATCHGPAGRGDGPDAELFVTRPRDLGEGVLAAYPTADLVRRVRDGRSLRLALDPQALRRRIGDVERMVAYLQRLPTVDWRRVDVGWVVYAERCATCHGPFGTPVAPPPAGVRAPRALGDPDFQASISDATLAEVVRHGRDGMPALTPRVDEVEAADVAACVRLLSPAFAAYTSTCAVCHGDHGVPNGSFAEALPQPTVIFDRAYFARQDPEALRGAIWHMLDQQAPAMPHFAAVLTAAEAEAVVEYLKRPR